MIHILCVHASGCNGRCSKTDTACYKRGLRIVRDGVLVCCDMSLIQKFLDGFSCQFKRCQVNQHQVVICTAGYDLDTAVHQSFAKCLCVIYDTVLIGLEAILKCLFEANSFGSNDMHQRSTLDSREYCFIEVEVIFLHGLFGNKDHTASWSTQCFMSCSCNNVCIVDWAWMKSCSYQTCDVCHIYHEVCAAFVCDVTETCKINGSCVSTCACDDHFRFALHSNLFYFIVIDKAFIVYTVRYDVEVCSGEVYRASVCQMSAMI